MKGTTAEHTKRVQEIRNYISRNISSDLSLEKLAKAANYSPFHFQRVFKQVTGESPKQYIVRVKLETAAHYLIVHPHKTISEIASDCGFSSPGIFSRAFKNFFGISPDELKSIPIKERLRLYKKTRNMGEEGNKKKEIKVVVKNFPGVNGIFINTAMEVSGKIQQGFEKLARQAQTHQLLGSDTRFMGIIHPNQDLYRVFLPVPFHRQLPKNMNTISIAAGRYASCILKGETGTTFNIMQEVAEHWLPDSGYRMGDIFCFEILHESPLDKPYKQVKRELYFPVVPI